MNPGCPISERALCARCGIPPSQCRRQKAKTIAEMVDRCRRFDSCQAVASCQTFPGKCQPLGSFMVGRGLVWISLWIENLGRPENAAHHALIRIGPESALSKVGTDTNRAVRLMQGKVREQVDQPAPQKE
jgi:hypothetical protein